jgi:hypothetical protein
MHTQLENISGMLVLPFPYIPKEISLGSFERHRDEIQEMHQEVRFCLWAMSVSLAVYMKLLYLVDISVRHEISDTVGKFLSEWTDGRGHRLSDALDTLIVSEFTKRSITPIPDMARLQREKHCESISSTVASYIRDIAVNLDNMRQGDVDSTFQSLFPHTVKFIGRCFFPRFSRVSLRLLDMLKQHYSSISTPCTDDSLCSTLSTASGDLCRDCVP